MLRLSVLLLFSLGLAGCFHVQLNGGIAAAEVTVASLERPQEIIARLYSHDPETMVAWKGQAAWDAHWLFGSQQNSQTADQYHVAGAVAQGEHHGIAVHQGT